jgi:triphosphoribosyl-dephospho-CoA synthetase
MFGKLLETLNDFSRETLLMTLIGLIRDVEDTVLLKRAESLDRYLYYRKLIGSITNFDEERIKEITRECIENNLSFGGSADLLIVTIFLKKVEGCLKLNYESDLSDWSL